MESILNLTTLAKTSIVDTDYISLANTTTQGYKKISLSTLFPAFATSGAGSEDIWISITNKNQLNFKGIKSGDTGLLTVATTTNNIVLTALEAGIDLSLCNNTTSGFASGVDFTGIVTGENSPLNGGTGLSTIAKGAMLYASATNTIAATSPLSTNGQLLIGNTTTGYPSVATLTGGTNVTIANTAGAISIAASLSTMSAVLDMANYGIDLGTGWLSGNGTAEGININSDGKVFIGEDTPTAAFADSLNIKGGIRFTNNSAPAIKPTATTGTNVGMAVTLEGGGSASGAAGNLNLTGGTASGNASGGNIILTAGRDTSGSADGDIQLKTYTAGTATAGLTVAAEGQNVTVNTGNLVITQTTSGIIHAGSGTVTQGTNATTSVVINSTSGIITLYGAALASQAEVEFTMTNSTIQADSVILTGLEVVASGRTAGANIQVYLHTKASGSVKIVVVNVDDVATDASDIFKINYLVINNS